MTLSGMQGFTVRSNNVPVLIPLLVDDPLWVNQNYGLVENNPRS